MHIKRPNEKKVVNFRQLEKDNVCMIWITKSLQNLCISCGVNLIVLQLNCVHITVCAYFLPTVEACFLPTGSNWKFFSLNRCMCVQTPVTT